MNLIISGKQLELTASLKATVEKEFAFLGALFNEMSKPVTVTLEATPEHKVSVLMYYESEIIRFSEAGDDLYQLIPTLAKRLEKHLRGLKKLKKTFEKSRNRVAEVTPMDKEESWQSTEVDPIQKRKSFELKPMSEAEAILQMKSLGHPKFIFANAEYDGNVCLLYTRRDGTYGLIETVL